MYRGCVIVSEPEIELSNPNRTQTRSTKCLRGKKRAFLEWKWGNATKTEKKIRNKIIETNERINIRTQQIFCVCFFSSYISMLVRRDARLLSSFEISTNQTTVGENWVSVSHNNSATMAHEHIHNEHYWNEANEWITRKKKNEKQK